MAAPAEIIVRESTERAHDVDIPTAETIIRTNSPRAAAVAKFRELADRLEAGVLNGASCQWNDSPDQPAMAYVEVFPKKDGRIVTRLVRVTFEAIARVVRGE